MASETPAIQSYVDQFKAHAATLPGAGLPWLDELRAAGLDRFVKTGFPTPRQESWKFTSLRPLERQSFGLAPALTAPVPAAAIPTVAPGGGSHRMVFLGGRYRPDLSDTGGLPPGATLESLGEALVRSPDGVAEHLGRTATLDAHPLLALNLAFLTDGVVLRLARGTVVPRPVELVFLSNDDGLPAAWHPRILVLAEENAEATLIEHHVGLGSAACFSNVVAEIVLDAGARLHHYKIQRESLSAIHLATTTAHVGRDATYDTFILNLGAALSRHEGRSVLEGTGTTCRISGAYAVRGTQHTDITTLIDHAKPRGTSREVVKGVIDGQARAVFQGKIIVRPDAQKTDGYQLNRALLLSDQAEIDSKPELEIYADDVKCSHGATAGELDDAQLFYLRSRGLPLERARALLIAAFLDEALEEIPVEAVRDHFKAAIHGWLGER